MLPYDQTPAPIQMISIYDILPDPAQPRRPIPQRILANWDGSPRTIATQIFDPWFAAAEHEKGSYIDLDRMYRSDETRRSAENTTQMPQGPLEASLMQIIELAISIQREKLLNPITIAPFGKVLGAPQWNSDPFPPVEQNIVPPPLPDYMAQPGTAEWQRDDHLPNPHNVPYIIETGERRYLAFHLLSHTMGYPTFQVIPARVQAASSIWAQALENNVRSNLNTIGRARQFAILLMDLLKSDGYHFHPITSFKVEQDYYAQVADAKEYRVPRGMAEMMVNTMGVKHVDQLTRYRHMLRLPNELWRYADENNLSHLEISKREKTELPTRVGNSQIADPTNILSDRAYQKKFAKIWRDMTQKRRVSNALLDETIQWLSDIRAEYGTDDLI